MPAPSQSRWRRLANVELRPELSGAFGVPRSCADCTHHRCDSPPPIGGRAWGAEWARCPRAVLRDDPHYQVAAHWWSAGRVHPLAGWPSAYAAWLVDAVMEIQSALDARLADAARPQEAKPWQ